MKIKVYHGSQKIINKPIYGLGKTTNDYGQGFYLTEDRQLANEWASNKVANGYCNEYELDITDLKILDLRKCNALYWLSILIENRIFALSGPIALEAKKYITDNFKSDYRNYDVIIGYRADDSYFAFAQDFLNNSISYQSLKKAMELGNLGEQVVLISKKAFDSIIFVSSSIVDSKIYYPKKMNRDMKARNDYFSSRYSKRNKKDLFVKDIIDMEIKDNDIRLQ